MAKKVFNLAKAISTGHAWTRSGDEVILNQIYIGKKLYPIIGTVLTKYGTPMNECSWTLTGRHVCWERSDLDLTTMEP